MEKSLRQDLRAGPGGGGAWGAAVTRPQHQSLGKSGRENKECMPSLSAPSLLFTHSWAQSRNATSHTGAHLPHSVTQSRSHHLPPPPTRGRPQGSGAQESLDFVKLTVSTNQHTPRIPSCQRHISYSGQHAFLRLRVTPSTLAPGHSLCILSSNSSSVSQDISFSSLPPSLLTQVRSHLINLITLWFSSNSAILSCFILPWGWEARGQLCLNLVLYFTPAPT